MKIALFGSRYHDPQQTLHILDVLNNGGAEVYMQEKLYNHLSKSIDIENKIVGIINSDTFDADVAISIGGDGTFLRTTSAIGKKNIPILGVNAGRLGFLADTTLECLEASLSDVLKSDYRIEERTLLQLSTKDKNFSGFNYALNDVAILKQDSSSMITVHAYINGEFLTSYEADGLIVATPTGSTAYSMSAGGPILTPTSSGFILTAVAPHSLTFRPLVVEDSSIITLDVECRSGNFLISLDGRSTVFQSGTQLTLKKADFTLKVVKRLKHTFFGTLRDKLMWGVDPRLDKH